MKKKNIKWIIIAVVVIIIFAFLVLIYNSVFSGRNAIRNKDILNYKLTNNEINSVQDKIKEVPELKNVDVHTNNNSKIIKIVVTLSSDVDFDQMKKVAEESLNNFSEDNLSYYDIEFYIDTENEESEIYPQIGYKFNSNSEFSW